MFDDNYKFGITAYICAIKWLLDELNSVLLRDL